MTSPRHAVIASPVLPEHDRESGSRRLFNHVEMLRELGWHVSYVTDNPYGDRRYSQALEQLGCAVYHGFGPAVDQLFSVGNVDLMVIAFWYLAEQHVDRLRSLSPATRFVVDSIDIHFLRNARKLLGPARDTSVALNLDNDFVTEFGRELMSYAKADAVLTVSDKEANLVNDFLGERRAAAVVDAERLPFHSRPFADRRGLLFVGNFRHLPNRDAARFLCREVLPLVDPKVLEAHPLRVVGNALDEEIRAIVDVPHVEVVGWVPEVVPYLHRARASVIPLRYGAGTKRKLLQAMMTGLPSVTTSVGAEGFSLIDGEHALIADDARSFAAAMERIVMDRPLWERLAAQASDHVRHEHDWHVARAQLNDVCNRALARPARVLPRPSAPSAGYPAIVAGLVGWIHQHVSANASVSVASKGDPSLVELRGRRARHLPAGPDGQYVGFHPATSDDIIEELDAVGSDHLVLPSTMEWWLAHYVGLREALAEGWDELSVPIGLGRVFRRRDADPSVSFRCNICGVLQETQVDKIERDNPTCTGCGSTARWRSVVRALLVELLGAPALLGDVEPRPQVRGLGLSDWAGYAERLVNVFDYENTFLRFPPSLDVRLPVSQERAGRYDFVLASDVLECIDGEPRQVLERVAEMLRPQGILVLTTPLSGESSTVEFERVKVGTSTDGEGPVRQVALDDLLQWLDGAGFTQVTCHDDFDVAHGVFWLPPASNVITARVS